MCWARMKTLWEALGLATIRSLMNVIVNSALQLTHCEIEFDWLPTGFVETTIFIDEKMSNEKISSRKFRGLAINLYHKSRPVRWHSNNSVSGYKTINFKLQKYENLKELNILANSFDSSRIISFLT